jgi:hypothetical protein
MRSGMFFAVCGFFTVLTTLVASGPAAAGADTSAPFTEPVPKKWPILSDCPSLLDPPLACEDFHLGAQSAESYRDSGSELIRIGQWNGWGHFQFLIEFSRADAQNWLDIRDISGEGRSIVVPVRNEDWQQAVTAWRAYEASQPPPPQLPDQFGRTAVCVAADGPSQSFEVVLSGEVRRTTDGGEYMKDNKCYWPDYDLAETLLKLAVDAVPYCAAFSSDDALDKMNKCLTLDGDKYKAAELESRAEIVAVQECETKKIPLLDDVIATDAVVDDGSKVLARGRAGVKAAWMKFGCTTDRYRDSNITVALAGDGGGDVAGRTRTWRVVDGGDIREATFLQKWENQGGKFMLVHMTLGQFRRTKDE